MMGLAVVWVSALAVTNGFLAWCWRDAMRDADFWYESSERWMHAARRDDCPKELR